ncbi:MAG: DUF4058 family protein [Cyanobacteria bacterium P01_A01_bin.114]
MPSPFPGMDPYLEKPTLWPTVHSRLIVAMADYLNETLSERYRAEIEQRVYLAEDPTPILVGIPDVSVTAQASIQSNNTITLPRSSPRQVRLPIPQEIKERYLEIQDIETATVVTVIEVLSPKNKAKGQGFDAYQRKRQQVLTSDTHLVEIDLLRKGTPPPVEDKIDSDYRILVSRSQQRPNAELYEVHLRKPLPTISLPLAIDDADCTLNLQNLLDQVYQRGRYHMAINYSNACEPPLNEEDITWAREILESKF